MDDTRPWRSSSQDVAKSTSEKMTLARQWSAIAEHPAIMTDVRFKVWAGDTEGSDRHHRLHTLLLCSQPHTLSASQRPGV